MKALTTLFFIECKKLQRSKIVAITFGLFLFIPVMMGLLVFLARNPELAGKAGLISMKAAMFGENDWTGYMLVILQVGAGLGMVGSGFIFSYIFGREYTDKTLKDLLALPVSRATIVVSKLLVGVVWCTALFVLLYFTSILAGLVVGVTGDASDIFATGKGYAVQGIMTILISFPVAYFASFGKGVMAPLGFVFLSMILANLVATVGIGPVFPWAIPGLVAMNSTEPGLHVSAVGYILFSLTVVAGIYLTLQYWFRADHQ